ncbi:YcgN family cysteine cluster protein [Primorskyibacter sp. S187A]|uniref:YcgN family cysteine cluster protein n=1 Tax=Primorskyibacter sp. S187A TaxID=3415130 RepID=UPI003C7C22EE
MSDPIPRAGLTPRFWERKKLSALSPQEWEALCDGCGKCCMNKLEDDESGEVAFTRVACRLFDDATCRCANYDIRRQFVPECIQLTHETIANHAYWLPQTCAYKLLWEGKTLPEWHPLLSGTAETVHAAGVSMQNRTIPEFEVSEEDWEDHIIEEPL